MKILLIEDEQKIGHYVAQALTGEGHEVEVVLRGDDGRTAATTKPYDVILLDLALPGCDGIEVLQAI